MEGVDDEVYVQMLCRWCQQGQRRTTDTVQVKYVTEVVEREVYVETLGAWWRHILELCTMKIACSVLSWYLSADLWVAPTLLHKIHLPVSTTDYPCKGTDR